MTIGTENTAQSLANRFQGNTREELIARYVFEHAKAGDADSVVKAMDAYARQSEEHYMFVGDDKGPIVDEVIRKHKPKVSFELGTYCGYSAVRFGKLASDLTSGAKYYAFEYNPTYLEIAKEIVNFAGLSHVVEFTQGAFNEKLNDFLAAHPELMEEKIGCKEHGDCRDNILYPGAPDYYDYVKNSPNYSTVLHDSNLEYREEVEDAVAISVRLYIGST
ncbi:S-adenosyl-L-methionine-dependent methyltransferase [Syncephalis plumigaleata]|nr:S-adenosyl-L-methionine-dependent methyltransferase [Syncephalis plumigaleata]